MRNGSHRTAWGLGWASILALAWPVMSVGADAANFETVRPLLQKYCFDCHADGSEKGGVAFDSYKTDQELFHDHDLWWKVLKNVRAGVMPPAKKPQPTADEKVRLGEWIKRGAFGIDPNHPDPGRVGLRRLNRVEYRNTIRDLMGIDFNTTEEFPPDDTGYGFDTIADVLSVSPLLLEKYMQAAEKIVTTAVPTVPKVADSTHYTGKDFRLADGSAPPDRMTFYKEFAISAPFKATHAGDYRINTMLVIRGDFDFDPGRCKLTFKVDGEERWSDELVWQDGKRHPFEVPLELEAGEHKLSFDLKPLTPIEEKKTAVDLQINSVNVEGPLAEKYWTAPKGYKRFFSREYPPTGEGERTAYAREVLGAFAKRAFRRPADERTIGRLVAMAQSVYGQPGKRFEEGIARAMVAVLSSPRFLFRVEENAGAADAMFGPVDEYALASRLSYFLWSTMPDEELFGLAERGELRKNLDAQVKRLIGDPRSRAFVENFTGQWLQGRDVEGISIDARLVLARDNGQEKELQKDLDEFRARLAQLQAQQQKDQQANAAGGGNGAAKTEGGNGPAKEGADRQGASTSASGRPGGAAANDKNNPNNARAQFNRIQRRFQKPAVELDGPLREAMRLEPEMVFASIVKEDGSVADLLDSDWTFLNDRLAKHYGVPGVTGKEMRRVKLPTDSPRGGLITMGSVLVVTSNPTRTSPVKRGQFILDNILGMPTPPPPADVPALEEADKAFNGHEPTVREALQVHRDSALCRSCHARMDPLGFSLENFNPMGMWRTKERGQEIDASGQLITGETFHDVRDLKRILKTNHRTDFYRCLTEKVMTYALGRGLEYYDVDAVDRIVDRLEKSDGRFSALLTGVIESAPFQERRNQAVASAAPRTPGAPAASAADSRRVQTRAEP